VIVGEAAFGDENHAFVDQRGPPRTSTR
jgi:hypothetical protein